MKKCINNACAYVAAAYIWGVYKTLKFIGDTYEACKKEDDNEH